MKEISISSLNLSANDDTLIESLMMLGFNYIVSYEVEKFEFERVQVECKECIKINSRNKKYIKVFKNKPYFNGYNVFQQNGCEEYINIYPEVNIFHKIPAYKLSKKTEPFYYKLDNFICRMNYENCSRDFLNCGYYNGLCNELER